MANFDREINCAPSKFLSPLAMEACCRVDLPKFWGSPAVKAKESDLKQNK